MRHDMQQQVSGETHGTWMMRAHEGMAKAYTADMKCAHQESLLPDGRGSFGTTCSIWSDAAVLALLMLPVVSAGRRKELPHLEGRDSPVVLHVLWLLDTRPPRTTLRPAPG